jgi:hypothetical protein
MNTVPFPIDVLNSLGIQPRVYQSFTSAPDSAQTRLVLNSAVPLFTEALDTSKLRSFLIQRLGALASSDLNWLQERTSFKRLQGILAIDQSKSVQKPEVWNEGEVLIRDERRRNQGVGELKTLFYACSLLNRKTYPHAYGLSWSLLGMFLCYDLMHQIGWPRAVSNEYFFEEGHCFGSVLQGLFILTRESGGATNRNDSSSFRFVNKGWYTDTDGSPCVGVFTFRLSNPYLRSVINFLVPDATGLRDDEYLNLLGWLARLPISIQYYLVVLANRLRNRNVNILSPAHLRPLDRFSAGVSSYVKNLHYSPDIVETYLGNLGRLKQAGLIRQDFKRVSLNETVNSYRQSLREIKRIVGCRPVEKENGINSLGSPYVYRSKRIFSFS